MVEKSNSIRNNYSKGCVFMKKIKFVLFFMICSFFLPYFVYAEECSQDGIKIESIQLKDKTEYVEEKTPATLEANKIGLDLQMYEVGDYVEYELKVSNSSNESYYFDKDLLADSDYFDYSISYKDQDHIIKPNEKKEVLLRVQYKKEIGKNQFYSGKYQNNNSVTVSLSINQGIIDIITNPETGRTYFVIGVILLMIGLSFLTIRRNKKIKLSLLFLFAFIVIPSTVYAVCQHNIDINSNITVSLAKPNPCTFDGELVQGTEYVNGQYTYHYMQQFSGSTWNNRTDEGWGVTLTDKNSTDDVITKLCTTINDKPIVSMYAMFFNSKTSHIDLSSFDTSNVTDMSAMFYGVQGVEEYDLSSFNTENVTNMSVMFQNNISLKRIDLSSFDTKNVVNQSALFYGNTNLVEVNMDNWDFRKSGVSVGHFSSNTKLKKVSCKNWKLPESFTHWISRSWNGSSSPIEEVDVTGWNLSETKNIQGLFADSKSLKRIIGLDTWDTSNIENMNSLFYGLESITDLDLSHFNTSHVTDFGSIIAGMTHLVNLNMDNWDFSNYYDFSIGSGMFYRLNGDVNSHSLRNLSLENAVLPVICGDLFYGVPELKTLNLKNVDTSKTTNMKYMFNFSFGCEIEELDVSSFDTSNVTDMLYMFRYVPKLKELDLSSFDISKVSASLLWGMFEGLPSLEKLDLSGFDLSIFENPNTNIGFGSLKLKELVTPKNLDIGTHTIRLDNTMYAKGDSVGITAITKDTPTKTVYKSQPWN